MKDISNHTIAHLCGLDPQNLKTTTRDKEFLTGHVIAHQVASKHTSPSDQMFEIASITKTFSAATIIRLASQEYHRYFDASDPMATKIASFEPLLKEESHRRFFQELKEKHPYYHEISLRNILNHSSGIMDNTWQVADEIRSNPQQARHLEDHYQSPTINPDKFNVHAYSNPPYDNVLRPIIEAVTGEKFCDVVRREIIKPQALRNTVMYDQAKDNPQIMRGLDYYQGHIHPSQSHNFDSASGGMAASAADVQTFFQNLVSGQVFNDKGNAIFFDERNFSQKSSKAQYGLGIEREIHGDHQCFSHGGACFGGYSYVISQKMGDEVQTAATVMAYENITRPIAAALIGDDKKRQEDGLFYVDETLARKMKNLRNYYNDQQLIEMRSWLERDADKSFEERSQEFKKVYEQRCLYNKGLNPTTPEFSSYVNNSSDWRNIGQEMDSFIDLQYSPFEHESIDTKGYLITCMFKLAVAVQEGKDVSLSDKVRQFLDNIEGDTLTNKIKTYGDDIIAQHQDQHNNASALSSVASVYGVRAYMVYKGLETDEEISPVNEPQKYFDAIPKSPLPENTRKNLALAMENFERSAELGNVRSMGSVVMWAEKSQHPDFEDLNKKWTPCAALASTPSPNSMIDYGDMLKEYDYAKAKAMFEKAVRYGLNKGKEKLENIKMMQEDTWAARIRAEESNQSNQHVR